MLHLAYTIIPKHQSSAIVWSPTTNMEAHTMSSLGDGWCQVQLVTQSSPLTLSPTHTPGFCQRGDGVRQCLWFSACVLEGRPHQVCVVAVFFPSLLRIMDANIIFKALNAKSLSAVCATVTRRGMGIWRSSFLRWRFMTRRRMEMWQSLLHLFVWCSQSRQHFAFSLRYALKLRLCLHLLCLLNTEKNLCCVILPSNILEWRKTCSRETSTKPK